MCRVSLAAPVSEARGTSAVGQDLFFNTPCAGSFSTERSEAAAVKTWLSRWLVTPALRLRCATSASAYVDAFDVEGDGRGGVARHRLERGLFLFKGEREAAAPESLRRALIYPGVIGTPYRSTSTASSTTDACNRRSSRAFDRSARWGAIRRRPSSWILLGSST